MGTEQGPNPRRRKRPSRRERKRFYGDTPTKEITVVLPGPLFDWLLDFSEQRNISMGSLIVDHIELASGMLQEIAKDEWGVDVAPPPGQQALDNPWHPDNTGGKTADH